MKGCREKLLLNKPKERERETKRVRERIKRMREKKREIV